MNKFVMELVWHNCLNYPPREYWNPKLYVTNGEYIHEVEYFEERGWWSKELGDYIPFNELSNYWWADLEQTIQKNFEFTYDNTRNFEKIYNCDTCNNAILSNPCRYKNVCTISTKDGKQFGAPSHWEININ